MTKRYILIIFTIISVSIMAQERDSTYGVNQWGLCESTIKYTASEQTLYNPRPLVLVEFDDYNIGELDKTLWNYDMLARTLICNPEQQYYTYGSNILFHNGIMELVAKKETLWAKSIEYYPEDTVLVCSDDDGHITYSETNYRKYNYTSGEIQSNKKFQYGLYIARVKLPVGKGFWPAFWLYGGDPVYNEADIFEFWNSHNWLSNHYYPKKLNTNLHYYYWGDIKNCSKTSDKQDFSQQYHQFAMYWGRDRISWFVDGKNIRTDWHWFIRKHNGTLIPTRFIKPGITYVENQAYPHDPMTIFFNLAISNGNKAPNSNTPFPSKMEIDWFIYFNHALNHNVHVTNYNQEPLNTDLYNFIIGNNVTIDCDYPVLNNQHLKIKGKNEVVFKPGFHSKKGSLLKAVIDPALWERTQELSAYTEVISDTSMYENTQIKRNTIVDNNITNSNAKQQDMLIYLNQQDNHIVIDFNGIPYDNYNVSIINMSGHTIVLSSKATSSLTLFDISNYAKGLYIVKLHNNKSGNVITKKLIYF